MGNGRNPEHCLNTLVFLLKQKNKTDTTTRTMHITVFSPFLRLLPNGLSRSSPAQARLLGKSDSSWTAWPQLKPCLSERASRLAEGLVLSAGSCFFEAKGTPHFFQGGRAFSLFHFFFFWGGERHFEK